MFEEYEDDYVHSKGMGEYEALANFDAALSHYDDSQALANFDASLYGSSNSPALVSEPMQRAGQTGDVFDTVNGAIKKLGSLAVTASQSARALGQAVGSIESSVDNAQAQYQAGRTDAKRVTPVALWWETAPTTDKLMIGFAVVGLYLALR